MNVLFKKKNLKKMYTKKHSNNFVFSGGQYCSNWKHLVMDNRSYTMLSEIV